MTKLIFILIFISSSFSFAQQDHEGYILCIDNTGGGLAGLNEYYFIPLDYKNNNVSFDEKSIEGKASNLELKIRSVGGIKIYKYLYNFEDDLCIKSKGRDLEFFNKENLEFAYFHYDYNIESIKKDFYLKKIKKNKFYLAKTSFSGCKLIDENYTKSEILKMYIYEVKKIDLADKNESKSMIKFIKNSYCSDH